MYFFNWKTSSKDAEASIHTADDLHLLDYQEESYKLDDSYDGLGEVLEETKDDMNDDTFGINVEDVEKNFDFSANTQKMLSMMNNEQMIHKEKEVQINPFQFSPPVSEKKGILSDIQHIPSNWNENTQTFPLHSKMKPLKDSNELHTHIVSKEPFSDDSTKKHLKGPISLQEVEAWFFEINKKKNSHESTHDHFPSMKSLNNALYTETKTNPEILNTKKSSRISSRYNFYTNTMPEYSNQSEEEKCVVNEIKTLNNNNQNINDMSQYDGLMNASDKNFINRIQLSQLVSNDPYSDDFYYYTYTSLKNKNSQQFPDQGDVIYSLQNKQTSNNLKNKHNENPILRIQQQIQNIVAAGKIKPKATQLSLEGALGKISFSTVRTPRQILNVKRPSENNNEQNNNVKTCHASIERNHKFYLYSIEKIYDTLIEIEKILRKQKNNQQEKNELTETDDEQNERLKFLKKQIWKNLQVMEPISKNPDIVHPFISIISYNKGKKLIPRIFEHINSEQKLTILTLIAIYLDHLDVVVHDLYSISSESRPTYIKENIDIFTQVVLPSLLACVSEVSLQIIIELLSIILEKINFQLIAMTKIGLSFLTMFISRAEIIKQSKQANEEDLRQWRYIYNLMFSKLTGRFIYAFSSCLTFSDEIYPWQFMAACAISSTIEQQHVLVTEVRYLTSLIQTK